MSIRLRLASLWMPRFMMAREIGRIWSSTDAALDALLSEHVPDAPRERMKDVGPLLEERRAAMAQSHDRKVRALIDGVGHDRAIDLGRKALFRTGMALGNEARLRLGVKGTKEDLLLAAGVMYRILGIDFVIVDGPEGEQMEVTGCALSHCYSKETCAILSAVDEGTISGMSPRARMEFRAHITDGSARCVAMIDFQEKG